MGRINLSLDTKKLDLIVKNGEKFLISKEGEIALLKFLEMKRKFEEAEEKLKKIFEKEMKKRKIVRIDGEKIKILYQFFGTKYLITDENNAKDFCKTKIKFYPDSKLIDEFIEQTGFLPDGIEVNKKRKRKIVIKEINEED